MHGTQKRRSCFRQRLDVTAGQGVDPPSAGAAPNRIVDPQRQLQRSVCCAPAAFTARLPSPPTATLTSIRYRVPAQRPLQRSPHSRGVPCAPARHGHTPLHHHLGSPQLQLQRLPQRPHARSCLVQRLPLSRSVHRAPALATPLPPPPPRFAAALTTSPTRSAHHTTATLAALPPRSPHAHRCHTPPPTTTSMRYINHDSALPQRSRQPPPPTPPPPHHPPSPRSGAASSRWAWCCRRPCCHRPRRRSRWPCRCQRWWRTCA
jgi:hypothetical protein